MIALPASPGRGPSLYQATLRKLVGVARLRLASSPRASMTASTPIDAITSRTGVVSMTRTDGLGTWNALCCIGLALDGCGGLPVLKVIAAVNASAIPTPRPAATSFRTTVGGILGGAHRDVSALGGGTIESMRICTWNILLGLRLNAVLAAVRTLSDFHNLDVFAVQDVLGFTPKLEQFRAIINDMEARPPAPLTVIAGDLNTFGPPRLQMWRRIRSAAHGAGLVELTHGLRRTHWTAQKLDAIYARGPIAAQHRAWTLNVRASDHLPVFAEI